mmetsp:Transcript_57765/g.119387  ORF Transcript_57765/g.119387 Transcript_57765/m.119387 type:complete len:319 (-) Transcript_57765:94-1050(-)|eukprot:s506_g4.t1
MRYGVSQHGIVLVAVWQIWAGAKDATECNEERATNMLQLEFTRMKTRDDVCGHLLVEECDPEAFYPCSNNCRFHTNGRDCFRPLPDILAEYADLTGAEFDGFCYFNWTANWLTYNGPILDFEQRAIDGILSLRDSSYSGLSSGPLITYRFEGVENLTTHLDLDHYLYDDLYAYSLGFLQGQGLEPAWMKNTSLWIALSKQRCDEIQAKYNFTKDELILNEWLDRNIVLAVMTGCSTEWPHPWNGSTNPAINEMAGWRSSTDCKPVTHREYAKHFYVKCLLGHRNSAADMAYSNSRACLLDGNHIGHFSECPYSPDVDF